MRLILMRHGESQKDKQNPNRHITAKGKHELYVQAKKIQQHLLPGTTKLLCSSTVRNQESMQILEKVLGISGKVIVAYFDSIRSLPSLKKRAQASDQELTFYYLDLAQRKILPKDIELPKEVVDRLKEGMNPYQDSTNLILVLNAGCLEVFAILEGKIPLTKELGYGEFLVLDCAL